MPEIRFLLPPAQQPEKGGPLLSHLAERWVEADGGTDGTQGPQGATPEPRLVSGHRTCCFPCVA